MVGGWGCAVADDDGDDAGCAVDGSCGCAVADNEGHGAGCSVDAGCAVATGAAIAKNSKEIFYS